MSTVELSFAPRINERRKAITKIDTQIKELKQSFDGNRQHPEYRRRVEGLLSNRIILSQTQGRERTIIRAVNTDREKQPKKGRNRFVYPFK